MDESDHLTLVNAGDEEVVSQEEGGREGSAAGGEGGGCCCASAIAIAHMRAHRTFFEQYRYISGKVGPLPGTIESSTQGGSRPSGGWVEENPLKSCLSVSKV